MCCDVPHKTGCFDCRAVLMPCCDHAVLCCGDHPQAAHTAAVVEELSAEMMRILEAHPLAAERAAAGLNPANCVLLRGCGSRIQVPGWSLLLTALSACT